MNNRRTVSILIPYKFINNECLVYLQKRSENAERGPGYFSFWGGGEEPGESPDQTLEREIKEELGIDIKNYSYFGKYEHNTIKNIYTIKVDDEFEKKIKIGEGDYGRWFRKDEALNEPRITEGHKIMLEDFYEKLLV